LAREVLQSGLLSLFGVHINPFRPTGGLGRPFLAKGAYAPSFFSRRKGRPEIDRMAGGDSRELMPGDDTRERSAPPETTTGAALRQKGILVVEDEDLVRDVLEVGLQQRGFAVWLASNGLEAIEVYDRHRADIDLVLLDVWMPGLDGPKTWTVLEQLNPNLRCCFMSGDLGRYTEDELLALRAARVFRKPFKLDEVVENFFQLLGDGSR
jgi:CheY-like chemotaxis protein